MASTRSPTATRVDALAYGDDVAGHLAARRERQRRLDLVLALHEQPVDVVHAGGPHGDDDLAGPGLGIGPLLDARAGRWGRTRSRQRRARPSMAATAPVPGCADARGAARRPRRSAAGGLRSTSASRRAACALERRARHLHGGGAAVARGAARRRPTRCGRVLVTARARRARVAALVDPTRADLLDARAERDRGGDRRALPPRRARGRRATRRCPSVAEVRGRAPRVLVLEAVNDHENIGALFRNAAAFGVDAVVLDPTTADPLYRRSTRVSLGHVLRVPFARVADGGWPGALDELRAARLHDRGPDPGRRRRAARPARGRSPDAVALAAGRRGPGPHRRRRWPRSTAGCGSRWPPASTRSTWPPRRPSRSPPSRRLSVSRGRAASDGAGAALGVRGRHAAAPVHGGDVAVAYRRRPGRRAARVRQDPPHARRPGSSRPRPPGCAWLRERGRGRRARGARRERRRRRRALAARARVDRARAAHAHRTEADARPRAWPPCTGRCARVRSRGSPHDREPRPAERAVRHVGRVLRRRSDCVPLARLASATARSPERLPSPTLEAVAGAPRPTSADRREPPARLHGDLWAGNRLVDRAGDSWLIDPAAHGGHREFDLAMMRLFGGFGADASPPTPRCTRWRPGGRTGAAPPDRPARRPRRQVRRRATWPGPPPRRGTAMTLRRPGRRGR